MKRIKLTLGVSLFILTCGSMVVTNFVILPFWIGDILTRETRHLQQLLAIIPSASPPVSRSPLPWTLQHLIADTPAGCVYWDGIHHAGSQAESSCRQGMLPLIAAAIQAGTAQTSVASMSLFDLINSQYLYVAVPIVLPQSHGNIAAVGVPLSRYLHPLMTKEQVIGAYLLFNACILTVLAFFRMLKSYVQPVDRMVQAAENYQRDGLQAFLAERSSNELGQLSDSIHAMVQRIEADREKLAETVRELANKNALLRDNQREMVRAEKLAAVGRLAAGLAHEVGNPLGVVQGYLQLLAMGDTREEELADYTSKALKELARVDSLIRRLLDYARTGPGKPEFFEVQDFLAEIVEDLAIHPMFRGVSLGFVRQAEKCSVYMDRDQLRQVVLNCMLNAADAVKSKEGHTGDGSISLAASVKTMAGIHSMVQLSIADNGVGIPETLLDTVFDPFFTTKEPGAGTGLGLSVSLSLIESMGGRMDIHSIAGVGTTVLILLPLASERVNLEAEHLAINNLITINPQSESV